MAKEKFEARRMTGKINVACKYDDGTVRYWNTTKEVVVAHIVEIVTEYLNKGHRMTLRQLHYQLVTRNWIVNHQSAYKKLGTILDDCRYSGVIDWSAIEDRGRTVNRPYSVDDIPDAINDTVSMYKLNLQVGQPKLIELWSEKDALSAILSRVTHKYHVNLVVNKGYSSSSAMYNAYTRYLQAIAGGQKVVLLYFGDHDPSGLDMIRDITDRLLIFISKGKYAHTYVKAAMKWFDAAGYTPESALKSRYATDDVLDALVDAKKDEDRQDIVTKLIVKMWLSETEQFKVVPIGLTMAQIKKYKLPENPTKATDSRSNGYIKKFGSKCWEVDALSIDTLTDLIEEHIEKNLDREKFEERLALQEKEKRYLEKYFDDTYEKYTEDNSFDDFEAESDEDDE